MKEEKISDSWQIRFWSKVDKTDDCWLWLAGTDKDGYGKFAIGKHKQQKHYRAHRLSWYIQTGSMPQSSELVLHKCDTPHCVNLAHLFLGSQKDNVLDAISKNRIVFKPGEKHPHSKLTEKEVLFIKQLDLSSRVIAKMFGVSRSAIDVI